MAWKTPTGKVDKMNSGEYQKFMADNKTSGKLKRKPVTYESILYKLKVLRSGKDFSKYNYLIGIDVGVNTGLAIYDRKRKLLTTVITTSIHRAMFIVKDLHDKGYKIFVRFEDARLREYFGSSGKEKWMGAGSIKRDSKCWFDFLTDYNIPFEQVAPKDNITKVPEDIFIKITSYQGSTSEHGRDGSLLVFDF